MGLATGPDQLKFIENNMAGMFGLNTSPREESSGKANGI